MLTLYQLHDIQEMKKYSEQKILNLLYKEALNKEEMKELQEEFVVYKNIIC